MRRLTADGAATVASFRHEKRLVSSVRMDPYQAWKLVCPISVISLNSIEPITEFMKSGVLFLE